MNRETSQPKPQIDFPGVGDKPIVVVSNNRRNALFPAVVGVRISSAPKPVLATVVPLTSDDPLRGNVLCDDLVVAPKARLKRSAGALSAETMRRVSDGLAVALDLRL